MDEHTTVERLDPARPESIASLAAGLDVATRARIRLRPDSLVEVVIAGEVVGFVDHVPPVFVALAGERPCIAVEIAQRPTLRLAVEELRRAHARTE